MDVLLGIAVLLFGGGFLVRSVSSARNSSWAGPRSAGMRQRAMSGRGRGADGNGTRPIRHEVRRIWAETHAADWLKQRDHERSMAAKNGGTAPAAAPPSVSGPGRARQAATATVKRLGGPFRASTSGSSGNGASRPGGGPRFGTAPAQPVPAPNGSSRPPSPPPPASGRPAAAAAPRTPPAQSSPGGNGTVAGNSSGIAEEIINGLSKLQAQALSGNMIDKHEVVKVLTEVAIRSGTTVTTISRAMAEPDSHYGPEITEPIAKADTHFQAAGMVLGEADTGMATLGNETLRGIAQSGRQAPHYSELSESGGR